MNTAAHHFRTTNLFLVDGDFRRRAAISRCLSETPIHVVPFEHAQELVGHWPRVGLLLVHDDAHSVSNLLTHMTESGHWLPVIGYAENPSTRIVVQAVLEGAIDYIGWPFTGEEIGEVVAAADARAKTFGTAKLREALARSRVSRLTKRERQVLVGIAAGMSNRTIGEKLAISSRTVEIHRANMLTKMGAHHTSDAIRIAIEAALME